MTVTTRSSAEFSVTLIDFLYCSPLKVHKVCASAKEVCVVDLNGQLWRYGSGQLQFDAENRIIVKQMSLPAGRKATQIAAGR